MRPAHRLGKASHRAEIEHPEPRMMTHQVVAGMKIGMQEAEFDHLAPGKLVHLARDPSAQLDIDLGTHHVGQRIAVEVGHRQHPARA